MAKTLEEWIRGFAAKGELVHLSLVAKDGLFYCNFSAASPPAGYAQASDPDPVEACLKAFAESPAKPKRTVSARPEKEPDVTAAVNAPDRDDAPDMSAWTK